MGTSDRSDPKPPGMVEAASAWMYEGIWGVVAGLFLVPREPPLTPGTVGSGTSALRLKPGEAYLKYRRMWFWIGLTLIDAVIIGAWLIVCWRAPIAGAILALPVLAIAIVPDVLAYIAIHLSYDTTWYVITSRSMRLRSGVWTIHEMTLTFENVQNVEIVQGPIERRFGIATLKVETAGGASHGPHGASDGASNIGRLVGLENAPEVREWIMQRVKASRTTGLGDEALHPSNEHSGFSAEQVRELQAIRASLLE